MRTRSTCQHLERPDIDCRPVAGEPVAKVARAYDLSVSICGAGFDVNSSTTNAAFAELKHNLQIAHCGTSISAGGSLSRPRSCTAVYAASI